MSDELLGHREVRELLGLSKSGLIGRRKAGDFPTPIGFVSGGTPVWRKDQIRAYALRRSALYVEREPVVRLANEP